MNVLMLSTDRTIFDPQSPARRRMEDYARVCGTLSVIVFSTVKRNPQISATLSIYSTNSWSRFSYIWDAVRLAGSVKKRFDVVSTQDPFETGLAGKRISRRLNLPLHLQVHTDFLAPGFSTIHWPLNAIRLCIAPRVLACADGIRVVSEKIKDHLLTTYRLHTPISVIPIYTDLQQFMHLSRTRHPRFKTALLVVSRLEKEKRVSVAIEALKAARDAGIECGLTVIGSGREEAKLQSLAKRLGIAEWVEFAGFQNDPGPYYAQADVLLYPGAPYEGYGLAVLEAIAAGVPVLANDVGIAKEVGAVIADADFGASLATFLLGTHERPILKSPYKDKDEYLQKFAEDLAHTASTRDGRSIRTAIE